MNPRQTYSDRIKSNKALLHKFVVADLLWNIYEEIDFTTLEQKRFMNQIIGIFGRCFLEEL